MSKKIALFTKKKFENLVFYLSQKNLTSTIILWSILSTIVGILSGSASAIFLYTLQWVSNTRDLHFWLITLLPLGGMLIAYFYTYHGKGVDKGNHLILENIHHTRQIIPLRMAPYVYISTLITHLFGGSAGREGTALQMSAAVADSLTTPFKLSPHNRKLLLIAAIAGGFGSVFGTPFAGAVFALEISKKAKVGYFALIPALATALIADQVTTAWHIHHTHYHINVIAPFNFSNMSYSILAAILFGITAFIFTKMMHIFSSYFKKIIPNTIFRAFAGGIIIVLTIYISGNTRYVGLGIPVIESSFNIHALPYDFICKILFTTFTLSVGFKGGEVTPLFFIGATLGSTLAIVLPLPVSLLAAMGFIAVFAGATNTPIACIILGIEMFGYEAFFYFVIACVIAYFFSGKISIYKNEMERTL